MLKGVPAETPVGHTPSAVAPQTVPRHLTPGHTNPVPAHTGAVIR